MKVKELIKQFSKEEINKEILFSSDEELNSMYGNCRIDQLTDGRLVLFGVYNSEVE